MRNGDTFFVVVGGSGSTGGFNGGGTGSNRGGGASHIALADGLLSSFETSVDKLLLVARRRRR